MSKAQRLSDPYCRVLAEVERGRVTVSPGRFYYFGGGAARPAEVRMLNSALDVEHIELQHQDSRYRLTSKGLAALRESWPMWKPTREE